MPWARRPGSRLTAQGGLCCGRAIPALGEYASIQAEVKSGPDGKSRVDFLLRRPGGGLVYVEVKSVTLTEDVGPECCGPPAALKVSGSGGVRRGIPDAVTSEGRGCSSA